LSIYDSKRFVIFSAGLKLEINSMAVTAHPVSALHFGAVLLYSHNYL